MEKILSVIVPTYNMEKYLDRCLSSLVVEDSLMDTLEVIVVNDGSKDNSSHIAHSYENQYPQTFIVIDKENGNYGSCVNAALKVATGVFIRVLDADDCFDNDNFCTFLKLLLSEDIRTYYDCIFSDVVLVSELGKPNEFHTFKNHFPQESAFCIEDFDKYSIENIYMGEVTYRREKCLTSIQYHQTEGISYTDEEWVFLPLSMAEKFYYWPNIVYRYTVDRKGQTMDIYYKRYDMEMTVTSKLLSEYVNIVISSKGQEMFLTTRLTSRIKKTYFDFFIYYRRKLSKFRYLLKNLDVTIKNISPKIYEATDDCHYFAIINHRFVHSWRKFRSFMNPAIIILVICTEVKQYKNNNILKLRKKLF